MSTATTIADVIHVLERVAPLSLAAAWDNVGLLLGDRAAPCQKILTCLTLTEEVAAEAVAGHFQLIVTHHPILFRGTKRITVDTAEGRTILQLTRANIAVYSPHTCFDDGPGGINEQLAAGLGVENLQPLRTAPVEQCKIVVFVPESDWNKVVDAMFAAGAGGIGQYRECSFRIAGTGTFFGGDTTNPVVGEKGRREEVSEWRLEAICPKAIVAAVVTALRSAHSYEEPAYDIYPLVPPTGRIGAGRVGELKTPMPLGELASITKTFCRVTNLSMVGASTKMIRRVAIACGAAGEFLEDARRAKADVFVSGEMRFHDYLAAQSAGVALLLPGHYATERFAVEQLANWLNQQIPGVKANASTYEVDPVTTV